MGRRTRQQVASSSHFSKLLTGEYHLIPFDRDGEIVKFRCARDDKATNGSIFPSAHGGNYLIAF